MLVFSKLKNLIVLFNVNAKIILDEIISFDNAFNEESISITKTIIIFDWDKRLLKNYFLNSIY